MAQDKKIDPLALNKSDYVTSAAKAVLGEVPFIGSLLVEIGRVARVGCIVQDPFTN